jgi:hypothetical protein
LILDRPDRTPRAHNRPNRNPALRSGTRHGYGFEIIDVTGLRAGMVYPILRRLEGEGLVRSSWERASVAQAEGRPPCFRSPPAWSSWAGTSQTPFGRESARSGAAARIRPEPWRAVVGVSTDVKLEGPGDPLGPALFLYPADARALRGGAIVVRTARGIRRASPRRCAHWCEGSDARKAKSPQRPKPLRGLVFLMRLRGFEPLASASGGALEVGRVRQNPPSY